MEAMLIATVRALRSSFAPGMFGVFLKSTGLTLLSLAVFIFVSAGLFSWLGSLFEAYAWAQALPWLGGIGAGMLAWFLFPGIMPLIMSFFDTTIAALIERQDYPHRRLAAEAPFWQQLRHDGLFALTAISLNILILPLYLLMPGLHLLPFYLLNGYLLGREFFVMAARRHMTLEQAGALRKTHRRSVLTCGIVIAVLATIPLLNLLAPFWGVAVMVHLYHQLDPRPEELLPPQ